MLAENVKSTGTNAEYLVLSIAGIQYFLLTVESLLALIFIMVGSPT